VQIDDTGRIVDFAEKPTGDALKAMEVDTTVLGLDAARCALLRQNPRLETLNPGPFEADATMLVLCCLVHLLQILNSPHMADPACCSARLLPITPWHTPPTRRKGGRLVRAVRRRSVQFLFNRTEQHSDTRATGTLVPVAVHRACSVGVLIVYGPHSAFSARCQTVNQRVHRSENRGRRASLPVPFRIYMTPWFSSQPDHEPART